VVEVDELSARTDELIREGVALASAARQITDELDESLALLRMQLQGDADDD
jgi:hypothetical protein